MWQFGPMKIFEDSNVDERMTTNVILVVFSVHSGEKIWIIVNYYREDSFDMHLLWSLGQVLLKAIVRIF